MYDFGDWLHPKPQGFTIRFVRGLKNEDFYKEGHLRFLLGCHSMQHSDRLRAAQVCTFMGKFICTQKIALKSVIIPCCLGPYKGRLGRLNNLRYKIA